MQTARNCVLAKLWGENCMGEGSADFKNSHDSVMTVVILNFSASTEPQ